MQEDYNLTCLECVIVNKYLHYYIQIINKAKNRVLNEYCEKHHIIPRCVGGKDNKNNITRLTAREHLICHLLLIKFTKGKEQKRLFDAVWNMSNTSGNKINSRVYALLKQNKILLQRERMYGNKYGAKNKGRVSPTKGKLIGNKHGSKNKGRVSPTKGLKLPGTSWAMKLRWEQWRQLHQPIHKTFR